GAFVRSPDECAATPARSSSVSLASASSKRSAASRLVTHASRNVISVIQSIGASLHPARWRDSRRSRYSPALQTADAAHEGGDCPLEGHFDESLTKACHIGHGRPGGRSSRGRARSGARVLQRQPL